jgi:hypothetical protein
MIPRVLHKIDLFLRFTVSVKTDFDITIERFLCGTSGHLSTIYPNMFRL